MSAVIVVAALKRCHAITASTSLLSCVTFARIAEMSPMSLAARKTRPSKIVAVWIFEWAAHP